jgi:large-conductance mechanosensitive channel
MLKLKYILLFLISLSSFNFALAQQVKVSSSLERDSIWLGDQIKMILVAEYPVGTSLVFPVLKDSLANGVEVISRSARDSSKIGDGMLQLRQSFLITAFDSGPHPIAPFIFARRNGMSTDSLRSNALTLVVKVPNVDLKKGFADIKKPYGAPITFKELAPWIFGIILIATIVFFILYAINRRKKNIPLFTLPAKPKLPPHVIALSELDKLKEEQLWQHDKVKDYYTRLTDIIRVYLEERYEVPAMEQTTQEILTEFKRESSQIKGKLFNGLQKTLDTADLVKFAKYTPLADENHFVMVNAYSLVEETKIEPAAEVKKQVAQAEVSVEKEISGANETEKQS